MHHLGLGHLLSESWRLYRARFGTVLLLAPLLVVACQILTGVPNEFVSFIFSFAGFYFSFGLLNLCLKLVDGEEASFKNFLPSAKQFLSYIIAIFIPSIILVFIAFGFILLYDLLLGIFGGQAFLLNFLLAFLGVVVGFVVMARLYVLMPLFILDQNAGPIEALKRSWSATHGYTAQLIGYIFLMFALYILGTLLFVIGLVVTIPLVMILQSKIYRKITQKI